VLRIASRQFEAALCGAGVTKGDIKREHAAERGKEGGGRGRGKEEDPAKDGGSSSKGEGG